MKEAENTTVTATGQVLFVPIQHKQTKGTQYLGTQKSLNLSAIVVAFEKYHP